MANKLVVIINSLKVPKVKTILLYEMRFLVPNYSCLQNPWLGGYRPQIPVLSVLNWICWTPSEQNSWVRHCATYLINNIHVLTQDSLLQIYFMLSSTLNIFSVKAKIWPLEEGRGAVFSQCGIAVGLKCCLTVFLFTFIGLERHTPKSWVGPKQQNTYHA